MKRGRNEGQRKIGVVDHSKCPIILRISTPWYIYPDLACRQRIRNVVSCEYNYTDVVWVCKQIGYLL